MADTNAYESTAPDHGFEAGFGDYVALLKPRVMSLVVFTAFVGLWIAPVHVNPFVAFCCVLFIALGGGASGALNMWYDADIDAVMKRTAGRPVPAGRVTAGEALAIGLALSGLAVMMLGLAANWFAAGFLAFTIFFYAVVYTIWLKRWTPQNIVIGGAAGAFPPMIGWACVTGGVSLESLLMFALIFFWTPPHFWALALFANEDYKRANIPMMPVISGERRTKIQMLVYTILLFPLAIAPSFIGMAGWIYGIVATALGLFFIFTAVRVLQDETLKSARLMFGFSVFYLFALFLALMMDHT